MKSSSRIAFFLPSLGGGGAERVLLELANSFAHRGIGVDLLIGDYSGAYANEISSLVNVIPLRKTRVIACLVPLVRYLRREKPSSVLSTMMHANVLVLIARILSGVRMRVVIRESNVPDVWNGKPLAEGKSLLLKLATWVYPRADAIVCVSAGVRDALCDALQLDEEVFTTVILNPVVSESFFEKSRLEHKLADKDMPSRPYVLAVGRLTQVKGFDVLLEAFAKFRSHSFVDLLILGEGPLREQLSAQAEALGIHNHVYMPGFVENPFPLIRGAKLYVMSSRREGLPNALIQAVALKRRVVMTDIPFGPKEILDNDRYGLTVAMDDPIAMCEAMIEVMEKSDWPHPDENWYSLFSVEPVVDEYMALCDR